jgi:2-keto-4-pentenoate hydratase/2-oxohepta-3-ene-1,7-dioic acid hydratase in catechol pathway
MGSCLNYASHRRHVEKEEEIFVTVAGRPAPSDSPVVFAKFPTSLIPHEADIVFPVDATNVHFEGELALVIGKVAKGVSVADARSHVFGVTACNGLSTANDCSGTCNGFAPKDQTDLGRSGPRSSRDSTTEASSSRPESMVRYGNHQTRPSWSSRPTCC